MVENYRIRTRGLVEAMTMEFDQHPLWDYSLAVYGRDGVSQALITFQDRHDLDVNILLLCLWMGQSGRGLLTEADFRHALGVSTGWNPDIVCAIRAVRIRLRDAVASVPREMSDAVRKNLLALEIDCEHVEQLSIAAGLGDKPAANKSSEEKLLECGLNLKSYFDRKGCRPDGADRKALCTILSAAFDDKDAGEIRSLCDDMFG